MSKFIYRSKRTIRDTLPLSWESSHLYPNLNLNIHDTEILFSVGFYNKTRGTFKQRKVYLKNNILFYEEDPQSRVPIVRVLILHMPTAEIIKLPSPIEKMGYKIIFQKGESRVTFFIKQPQIWKKLLSRYVIWQNFLEDFDILKNLQNKSNISFFEQSQLRLVINKHSGTSFKAETINIQEMQEKSKFLQKIEVYLSKLPKLDHPSLVSLSRIYSSSTSIILVWEYFGEDKSTTLADIIQKQSTSRSPIQHTFQRSIVLQLYQVLDYLQRQKVVHGSIDPHCIKIVDGSKVKLEGLKFENSRLMGLDTKYLCSTTSLDKAVLNNFMASGLQEEELSYKSDLYSVGLIHYILSSGKNTDVISQNVVLELSDIIEIKQTNKNISSEELQVINGCTQTDKQKRLTIREVMGSDFFRGRNSDLRAGVVRQFKVRSSGMMVGGPSSIKRTSKLKFTGATNYDSDNSLNLG